MVMILEKSLSAMFRVLTNLTVSQIIAVSFIILFTRWVIRGIYRVYYHPLSRFPGPKLSVFTRIPNIHAVFSGSLHTYVANLHNKYGDVVRISPDEVSFTNPQAWRDIYGYGPKTTRGTVPPKHWLRYGKSVNRVDSLFITESDTEHARVRKIFTPAFSERSLTQQEPLLNKYADKLVQVLKEGIEQSSNGTKALDMSRFYTFATFDIMADLSFGESLHMLDRNEYDPWVSTVFGAIRAGIRINILNVHYPLAAKLINPILSAFFSKMRYQLHETNVARVTKRLTKGRDEEGVDLWSLILEQQEKGKEGLSREQMDSNATTFMAAGTETTATLLSGLTYLLLTHTGTMEKLVEEIRGTFKEEREITMENIARLPYLKASINEAFRLYPPVPTGTPHLTPRDGSTICGNFIPPGTTVAAPHHAMYTSPRNFTDPLSFVPERWTGDERFKNDERAALQPFSVGSRDCLGKNLAYHEMRLIITKVLWNFDLKLCNESENWMDQRVFTVWQKGALMVEAKLARG